MELTGLSIFLAVGMAVGYLAGLFFRGRGFGLLGNLGLGILGSLLGNLGFGYLGILTTSFLGSVLASFIGALLILLIASRFRR